MYVNMYMYAPGDPQPSFPGVYDQYILELKSLMFHVCFGDPKEMLYAHIISWIAQHHINIHKHIQK